MSTDYKDIILELMTRVMKLEGEVRELKSKINKLGTDQKSVSYKNSVEESNRVFNISSKPFAEDTKKVKDKTRYLYNNEVYLKNKLVLAVIKDFVKEYPEITGAGLKEQFKDSLQGAIGVVDFISDARKKKPKDCEIRYFTKNEDIIHVADGDMYVCSQWGILNIPNFIVRAKQLGFKIEEITK